MTVCMDNNSQYEQPSVVNGWISDTSLQQSLLAARGEQVSSARVLAMAAVGRMWRKSPCPRVAVRQVAARADQAVQPGLHHDVIGEAAALVVLEPSLCWLWHKQAALM